MCVYEEIEKMKMIITKFKIVVTIGGMVGGVRERESQRLHKGNSSRYW